MSVTLAVAPVVCLLLAALQQSDGTNGDRQPVKLLQQARIPEINVDRFEPLYLPRLSLSKGHGPVTLSGNFYNILAHGPSNATATYAVLDMKRRLLQLGVYLPNIHAEGEYNLQGKVLLLPLVGNGPAKIHLKNMTTSVSMLFELPRLHGRQVIHIVDMKVDFDMQGMTVQFDNLFNGNEVLGRTLNAFVNRNALEVVNELKEPLGESFSLVFKEIMNNAFSHMPIDIWLLDK